MVTPVVQYCCLLYSTVACGSEGVSYVDISISLSLFPSHTQRTDSRSNTHTRDKKENKTPHKKTRQKKKKDARKDRERDQETERAGARSREGEGRTEGSSCLPPPRESVLASPGPFLRVLDTDGLVSTDTLSRVCSTHTNEIQLNTETQTRRLDARGSSTFGITSGRRTTCHTDTCAGKTKKKQRKKEEETLSRCAVGRG